ncbi:response regulator [Janthinobacterium sp.]|uniref:response regulator n=1 Tax=Janthinobacterium sp. TaxID=1871054 RepID=UPI00293D2B65|nr:response regulator [Janthinobacterium sp.]
MDNLDFIAAPGAAPAGTATLPRVLHIDADADAALLLATLLLPEARLTHAPTLAAASVALGLGAYQLIVLDPDLPDGDGAALLEPLLAGAEPPAVLRYSARAGDGALHKPATSARQLAQAMARLLAGGAAPAS